MSTSTDLSETNGPSDRVLGDLAPEQVRVRFPPSPTGFIHVGNVRSALFNWAFARHYGGTLVLRIEDTDTARNTEAGYDSILDSLRWLGIDWDEGPEVGGPHAPYRQSERSEIYADVAVRLRESGGAYDCFCTTEEVEARRRAAGSKLQGYDGFCRDLGAEQRAAFEAEGRRPTLRLRMPETPIVFDDLVRGEITFLPENVPDFALLRANGDPLYTLVNPVDDALMGITHVLRGEDLLSSTPRQIALYAALAQIGVGSGAPRFGHLPIVMGEGNKRLSKRDAGSGLADYVDQGYLPAGLLNYLALLGWGLSGDRDVFTMAEMVEAFDIRRVNPNPARFDAKKLKAINSAHMRLLPLDELGHAVLPFLKAGGVVSDPVGDADAQLLEQAMPLVAPRINLLGEVVTMLDWLFVADADFAVDPTDAEKLLDASGREIVQAALDAVEGLASWSTEALQSALEAALIKQRGLKPRVAFGPVRVAVTGRRISPPLFESMELLGRERSLARLRGVLDATAVSS